MTGQSFCLIVRRMISFALEEEETLLQDTVRRIAAERVRPQLRAIEEGLPAALRKTVADDIYVKAVPFFEQAHELKKDDVPTIQQLMKLYAKTGDQAKYATMKGLLKE